MLLVFADDWGRHPSSCQHLVQHLLPKHQVVWVNTIGMRPPAFDTATLRRGWEKMWQWGHRAPHSIAESAAAQNPRVINPLMWPWFRSGTDRWLNRHLLTTALAPVLAMAEEPVHAITTVPIVADLIGSLRVDHWTYYCVDDFSTWPGLDHSTIASLERELLQKCDEVVAVSQVLVDHATQGGRTPHLLSHGVDLEFWRSETTTDFIAQLAPCERPLAVFWGVVDRRMDVSWVRELARGISPGTVLLVGPLDHPDPELLRTPGVVHVPAVPLGVLPGLGRLADVLVMPYADLPVTRAIQPLKLKEYLATGKPVVVRDLPAVHPWHDCLDIAHSDSEFVAFVQKRVAEGMPIDQRQARRRLEQESWEAKARQFERWVMPPADRVVSSDTRALEALSVGGV